jgi:hypothetical protein
VVLHVEPSGRGGVAGDLVDALTEFRIGIGREPGADALVCRREGLAAILAQIVAARGDAEVEAIPVAQDGVHAEPSVPRLPLSSVLMVTDARNHLPGISAVTRTEERCRLHAAEQVFLVIPRFERPDISKRASVILREGGRRLRFLELLAQVGRTQDLHAEERITARGVEARRSTLVDQGGVHSHPCTGRTIQREAATGLRCLSDEQAFFGTDGDDDTVWHVETPE